MKLHKLNENAASFPDLRAELKKANANFAQLLEAYQRLAEGVAARPTLASSWPAAPSFAPGGLIPSAGKPKKDHPR